MTGRYSAALIAVLATATLTVTYKNVSAGELTRTSAVKADMLAEVVRVEAEQGMIVVRALRGSKLVHKFYGNVHKLDGINAGNRVRIFYQEGTNRFERIETMTELKYGEGMNLGIIYNREHQ